MKLNQNVIVALDYSNPEDAFHLVDQVGEEIDWFKLGPTIFTQHGIEVIRFLHRRNKKIFVDLKLHDTPSVVSQTLRQFIDLGIHFTTVHCLGGKTMLEAASTSCRGSQLKLLGVTLLTSNSQQDSTGLGWTDGAEEIVGRLVKLAVEARLSGVLCAATEITSIKPYIPKGFLLVTPGIRLPEQDIYNDDQQRKASPSDALGLGSNYLVIGRPIIQTRDPLEVLGSLKRHLTENRVTH